MSSTIIFIEGNPGSGKSTFAKRLKQSLLSIGYSVRMYQEGDLHPIDLAWCAILTKDQYQATLDKYRMIKDDILTLTKPMNDQYVVAYTKVNPILAPKEFYDDMSSYEIYRSESLEMFKHAHQLLWNQFPNNMEHDTVYIFECVFIQNHINELILKYHLEDKAMYPYFRDLVQPLHAYHPYLIFIKQSNVERSIRQVAAERITNDPTKFKNWFDLVLDYMQSMPYTKVLGYIGEQGTIKYFNDRQVISLKIIDQLPIASDIVQLDQSYDDTYEKLEALVLNKLSKYTD